MNKNIEAKNIYYNFSSVNDKHFYAAVFNDFSLNWEMAFKQVYYNIKQKVCSEKVPTILNNLFPNDKLINMSHTDWEYFLDKLEYFLPFIKCLKTTNRKSFIELLIDIYEQAEEYRNYTTHLNRDLKPFNQDLCQEIDHLFLKSVQQTRKIRKHTDAKDQIKGQYKNSIKDIVKASNRKLKKKGKKNIRKEDEYAHAVNFTAHKYLYKLADKDYLKEDYKTRATEDGKLKDMSLFIFLSFGLTRKQLEQVLDVSKYYKSTQGLQHAFTRWVVTSFCFRQPKGQLSSQFSKDALMLQIADELSKCPASLFNHLKPEFKQEFIEGINTYVQEVKEEDVEISQWIIRKRYEDKFAYLAIRFLDECVKFPTLKFHVNIGKFRHDSREKYFCDGKMSIRNIDEKVSVFERLSVVHEKKYQFFNASEQEESKGWCRFPKPNYQFHKNNIGIVFMADPISEERLPIKERNQESKYDLAEKLGLKDQVGVPMAFLSFNELPALLYELLVNNKTTDEIEKRIKQVYFNKKNSIRNNQLTSTKLNLFMNLESNNLQCIINKDKFNRALDKAIKYRPINDIRSLYTREIKGDKMLFSNTEKGKIAVWLVKDMTKFTKQTYRKDWKGWQISEFQKLMAYYNTQKGALKAFIENELFNGYEGLMFTAFHFEHNTLEEFTNAYLNSRAKFLRGIKRDFNKGKVDYNHFIFDAFKSKNYIVKNTYKDNLLKMPMYLPRGIFDNRPTFEKGDHSLQNKAAWFNYANKQLNNKQVFYTFPRIYKFNNKDIDYLGNKGVTEQFKADNNSPLYIERGEIYKNEKEIRAIQRQDVFLLDMFKYGMSGNLNFLTLNDCFKSKKEKDESEKQGQEEQKNPINPVTYIDNSLFTYRVSLSLFNNRIQGKVALKDLPKYRRLEEDQRIKTFIEYNDTKINAFEDITKELDAYNRVRSHELFRLIHDLEDKIYKYAEKNNEIEELKQKVRSQDGEIEKVLKFKYYISYYSLSDNVRERFNKYDFSKEGLLAFMEHFKGLKESEYLLQLASVVIIRNKFAHNQYPSKEWFNYLKQYHNGEVKLYADYYLNVFKVLKAKIEKKLDVVGVL